MTSELDLNLLVTLKAYMSSYDEHQKHSRQCVSIPVLLTMVEKDQSLVRGMML